MIFKDVRIFTFKLPLMAFSFSHKDCVPHGGQTNYLGYLEDRFNFQLSIVKVYQNTFPIFSLLPLSKKKIVDSQLLASNWRTVLKIVDLEDKEAFRKL